MKLELVPISLKDSFAFIERQTALYGRVRSGAGQRRIPQDVCELKHGGNAESRAANQRVAPTKEQTRREVLAYAIGRGKEGITADEVVVAFGSTHNHIAPRISELLKTQELVRTTRRRKTTAGCSAVLVAKEHAKH